jgi:Fic family protein
MQHNQLWIWQHPHYPHFIVDESSLNLLLINTSKQHGKLIAKLEFLKLEELSKLITDITTNEIILTSQMEGEILQRESVRSSIRKKFEKLKEGHSTQHTDNLVSLQDDANRNYSELSISRLHHWHTNLFSNTTVAFPKHCIGRFRDHDEMYVISGNGANQKVHYHAIPHHKIKTQINALIDYCNTSKENPYIKSAKAHLWFESIHPYEDGNGRVGRVLTNHILSKELGLDSRYFSLSQSILLTSKEFYSILEKTNRLTQNQNMDITRWVIYHTQTIQSAINISLELIDKSIAKTKLYDKLKEIKINSNQQKAIDFLVNNHIITNSLYRNITGTNQVTASRQLKDLVNKYILQEVEGKSGRSTSYELYHPSNP